MEIFYMVLICLSAAFAAWAGVRAWQRFAPLMALPMDAGPAATIPALGFLTVVGAPAEMLSGALLIAAVLGLGGYRAEKLMIRLTLLGSAVLLGLTALGPLYASYLIPLPVVAAFALAGLWWYVVTASALFAPLTTSTLSYGFMASLGAVATAPLLIPAADSIALDAVIIASACGGMLLAGGARWPFGTTMRTVAAFLLAFLQVTALWQGAWISALASVALWLAACGWAWAESEQRPRYA